MKILLIALITFLVKKKIIILPSKLEWLINKKNKNEK
jgi:hypothetical protein